MINHYDTIENADDYESLNNDTANLRWLQITPHINQSVQHIVHVTGSEHDTGRENIPGSGVYSETNPSSEVYSEIDLHSNNSAVYTRPDKCDDTTKVQEDTLQYVVSNRHIKVKYVIIEVCIITLILVLLAHISCLEVVRNQTDSILKSDLRTKWRIYKKYNYTTQVPATNIEPSTQGETGVLGKTSQEVDTTGLHTPRVTSPRARRVDRSNTA